MRDTPLDTPGTNDCVPRLTESKKGDHNLLRSPTASLSQLSRQNKLLNLFKSSLGFR